MRKLTRLIYIVSVALIILGLIHLIATILILPMFQNLCKEQFSIFLFMYLATGLGTILPGVVSMLMVKGVRNKEKRSWDISMICSIYTLLLGVGAILTMNTNPFAYLMFLIGLVLFLAVVLVKKKLY